MRPGNVGAYCPDAGDIIWLDFLEADANEQAGRRPATAGNTDGLFILHLLQRGLGILV